MSDNIPVSCGRILSIQVGAAHSYGSPLLPLNLGGAWTSAIAKSPVVGSVTVGALGIEGDTQVDRENHGGEDKAVLMYASSHYEHWRAELGSGPVDPGAFGENLTVDGLDETTVCLGDIYEVGSVRFEVSQPRQPCWKLARRWDRPALLPMTLQTGRTGWYVRVVQGGVIEAGMELVRLTRGADAWTVDAMNRVMHGKPSRADLIALIEQPRLSSSWRATLTKRAG